MGRRLGRVVQLLLGLGTPWGLCAQRFGCWSFLPRSGVRIAVEYSHGGVMGVGVSGYAAPRWLRGGLYGRSNGDMSARACVATSCPSYPLCRRAEWDFSLRPAETKMQGKCGSSQERTHFPSGPLLVIEMSDRRATSSTEEATDRILGMARI